MVQKLTGDIWLKTVVRLIPWTLFGLNGYEDIPYNEEIVHEKWKEAMSFVGLGTIEPIEIGSFYAYASEMSDEILQHFRVLSQHIKPTELSESFGVCDKVILHNNDILFRPFPTSCSGHSPNVDWEEVAQYRLSEWKKVWIGYPWTNIRYEHGYLYFAWHRHKDIEQVDESRILYAIKPEKIAQAVKRSNIETEAFLDRYNKYFG